MKLNFRRWVIAIVSQETYTNSNYFLIRLLKIWNATCLSALSKTLILWSVYAWSLFTKIWWRWFLNVWRYKLLCFLFIFQRWSFFTWFGLNRFHFSGHLLLIILLLLLFRFLKINYFHFSETKNSIFMVLDALNECSFVYYVTLEIFKEFFKYLDLLVESSYLSHLV